MKKKLSHSEFLLLKILWKQKEPISISEISIFLEQDKIQWAYTTIATFLKRMEKKKLVTVTKKGRSYFYTSAVTDQDVLNEATAFVERYFKGSLSNFLAMFTKEKNLTSEEIRILKDWVKQLDDDNK